MLTPFPNSTPVTRERNLITEVWARWLTALINAVNATAQRIAGVTLAAQGASVTTTTAYTATTNALYRLSYVLRVTRAATTSSSATVTFGWTDGGVALSTTVGPLSSNTTTSVQSDTFTVGSDAGTAITYAIAYASVGATSMQYGFRLAVEQLP